MRKIIAIGECVLDVLFDGNVPRMSSPGGLILNVASNLGRLGHNVDFVGEVARDRVGDIIIDSLRANNVNTDAIDRYTDGVTPASLIFRDADDAPAIVRYSRDNNESFDVIWPRIDKDDILVFGGYYAIDPRVRPHLFEIVRHAAERKAIIVYVPGFAPEKEPRITRVMPSILENFEIADMVITRSRDLSTIFRASDDASAYKGHIGFYTGDFINFDRDAARMRYYHGKAVAEAPIAAGGSNFARSAGAIAGVIDALLACGVVRHSAPDAMQIKELVVSVPDNPAADRKMDCGLMERVLDAAMHMGEEASKSADGLLHKR